MDLSDLGPETALETRVMSLKPNPGLRESAWNELNPVQSHMVVKPIQYHPGSHSLSGSKKTTEHKNTQIPVDPKNTHEQLFVLPVERLCFVVFSSLFVSFHPWRSICPNRDPLTEARIPQHVMHGVIATLKHGRNKRSHPHIQINLRHPRRLQPEMGKLL